MVEDRGSGPSWSGRVEILGMLVVETVNLLLEALFLPSRLQSRTDAWREEYNERLNGVARNAEWMVDALVQALAEEGPTGMDDTLADHNFQYVMDFIWMEQFYADWEE